MPYRHYYKMWQKYPDRFLPHFIVAYSLLRALVMFEKLSAL